MFFPRSFLFFFNHLTEEERAGSFSYFILVVLSVPVPLSALGSSVLVAFTDYNHVCLMISREYQVHVFEYQVNQARL